MMFLKASEALREDARSQRKWSSKNRRVEVGE